MKNESTNRNLASSPTLTRAPLSRSGKYPHTTAGEAKFAASLTNLAYDVVQDASAREIAIAQHLREHPVWREFGVDTSVAGDCAIRSRILTIAAGLLGGEFAQKKFRKMGRKSKRNRSLEIAMVRGATIASEAVVRLDNAKRRPKNMSDAVFEDAKEHLLQAARSYPECKTFKRGLPGENDPDKIARARLNAYHARVCDPASKLHFLHGESKALAQKANNAPL